MPGHEDEPLIVDPEMRRTYDLLTQVAQTDLPVLLLGETGSGKEGAAQWLHAPSGRPAHRFVTINCAALSESVIESELFGHERGACAGALAVREGLFEAAHGGTLLLDEVGEFSARAQAKLLRVLETGEVVRVGSHPPRKVAVRPSEIVPLANLFLRRLARCMGRPVWSLADDAIAALLRHPWPGNVRELRNVVTRAATLCSGTAIDAEQLALGVRAPSSAPLPVAADLSGMAGNSVRRELRAFEKERILAALAKTDGNQTRAAVLLGLSRRTLTNKLNAYDIDRPRKRNISRSAAE